MMALHPKRYGSSSSIATASDKKKAIVRPRHSASSHSNPCSGNGPSELDAQFWLETVGTAVGTLMGGANYDAATIEANLAFVSQSVAPYLGQRPIQGQVPSWRSFMTDDFSPVEYSWSWEKSHPIIRYSFEPIGYMAGTALDPYNRKAPMQWVDHIRHKFPSADWQWFNHFACAFYQDLSPCFRGGVEQVVSDAPKTSSPSSIFVGFDLGRNGLMGKMYLVPVIAEQTGQSRFTILDDTLRTLPNCDELLAYRHLDRFLRLRTETIPLQILGAAVDCTDLAHSKLKIYFRSQATTFASVKDALTSGGTIASWDDHQLKELRDLWSKVLSLPPDFPEDMELPNTSHETSGVLYNYDIKPGNDQPETKVYIPVRHYGKNDHAIAQRLVDFLRARCGHEEQYYQNFFQVLDKFSSFRDLSQGCGLQTYISCALKEGKLCVTSYLSPQIYHPSRWLMVDK
ncbi:dimethylallyl tryptophan synthase [Talaromyces pinophilus]|uniref:Dimethylallyl tryptophan synthase n=1 Tax=Talaromyces pinophilus TaxID=128442 RepID=A0A6V8HTL2_TALPI|nr:dimethylallyl tryptophan synthase [Talaromyces pinophilus]